MSAKAPPHCLALPNSLLRMASFRLAGRLPETRLGVWRRGGDMLHGGCAAGMNMQHHHWRSAGIHAASKCKDEFSLGQIFHGCSCSL